MSAAAPAIPPRCWRISRVPWWAWRKMPVWPGRRPTPCTAAGLPTAKIVTGTLAHGCAGEGPYDVIVLEGSAEMVAAGAVRSAQGRRPAGRRARTRSGRQGHALSPHRRRTQRPAGVRRRSGAAAGFCQAARIRFLAMLRVEATAATVAPRAKGLARGYLSVHDCRRGGIQAAGRGRKLAVVPGIAWRRAYHAYFVLCEGA